MMRLPTLEELKASAMKPAAVVKKTLPTVEELGYKSIQAGTAGTAHAAPALSIAENKAVPAAKKTLPTLEELRSAAYTPPATSGALYDKTPASQYYISTYGDRVTGLLDKVNREMTEQNAFEDTSFYNKPTTKAQQVEAKLGKPEQMTSLAIRAAEGGNTEALKKTYDESAALLAELEAYKDSFDEGTYNSTKNYLQSVIDIYKPYIDYSAQVAESGKQAAELKAGAEKISAGLNKIQSGLEGLFNEAAEIAGMKQQGVKNEKKTTDIFNKTRSAISELGAYKKEIEASRDAYGEEYSNAVISYIDTLTQALNAIEGVGGGFSSDLKFYKLSEQLGAAPELTLENIGKSLNEFIKMQAGAGESTAALSELKKYYNSYSQMAGEAQMLLSASVSAFNDEKRQELSGEIDNVIRNLETIAGDNAGSYTLEMKKGANALIGAYKKLREYLMSGGLPVKSEKQEESEKVEIGTGEDENQSRDYFWDKDEAFSTNLFNNIKIAQENFKNKPFVQYPGEHIQSTVGAFNAGVYSGMFSTPAGIIQGIGDILTKGEVSGDYLKIAAYLEEHPYMQKSLFEGDIYASDAAKQAVYQSAGVSPTALEGYIMANRGNWLRSETTTENVGDLYNKIINNTAYSLGQQLPAFILTAGIGGGSNGIIGVLRNNSLKGLEGAELLAGKAKLATELTASLKNLFLGNPTTWLMSSSSAAAKLTQNAMNSGFSLENYVNALGTGYIEMFTEGLFGYTDAASVLNTRSLKEFFLNALEEGAEEIIGTPLGNLIDKATISPGMPLFGEGGVFDLKEMALSGITGALSGMVMGSVGFISNTVNIKTQNKAELQDKAAAYMRQAEIILPEAFRPELDIKKVTESSLEQYAKDLVGAIQESITTPEGVKHLENIYNALQADYELPKVIKDYEGVSTGALQTQAFYDPTDNTIHMPAYTTETAAYSQLLMHELVHYDAAADAGLVNDVISVMADKGIDVDKLAGQELENAREIYTEIHQKDYEATHGNIAELRASQDARDASISGLDESYAKQEVVAKYIAENVNTEAFLQALEENKPGTLLKTWYSVSRIFSKSGKSPASFARMTNTLRTMVSESVGAEVGEYSPSSSVRSADTIHYSLVGINKDGVRIYESDFKESDSEKTRLEYFKKRIGQIFALGAVELKTDVKKILVNADKFTYKKNKKAADTGIVEEFNAKVSALYDLVDILETSKFISVKSEESYINPNIPPKNKAHENVKYWYKFENGIILDGVKYNVTFNIRDKGKEQYQYLIEFHNKGEAAKKQLVPVSHTAQSTSDHLQKPTVYNSISNINSIVNKNEKNNTVKRFSIIPDESTPETNYEGTVLGDDFIEGLLNGENEQAKEFTDYFSSLPLDGLFDYGDGEAANIISITTEKTKEEAASLVRDVIAVSKGEKQLSEERWDEVQNTLKMTYEAIARFSKGKNGIVIKGEGGGRLSLSLDEQIENINRQNALYGEQMSPEDRELLMKDLEAPANPYLYDKMSEDIKTFLKNISAFSTFDSRESIVPKVDDPETAKQFPEQSSVATAEELVPPVDENKETYDNAKNFSHNLVQADSKPYKGTPKEQYEEVRSWVARKWTDTGDSIKQIGKIAKDNTLYPYYQAAKGSTFAAINTIQREQTDMYGKRVGKAMHEIFKPIRKKGDEYYNLFQGYMYHQINIERMRRPLADSKEVQRLEEEMQRVTTENKVFHSMTDGELLGVAGSDNSNAFDAQYLLELRRKHRQEKSKIIKPVFGYKVTAELSEGIVSELEALYPEFKGYAKEIYQYLDNLMQYRIDSGLVTGETRDMLKEIYPHYVPVMREWRRFKKVKIKNADGTTRTEIQETAESAETKKQAEEKENDIEVLMENSLNNKAESINLRVSNQIKRATGGKERLVPLDIAIARQTIATYRESAKNRLGNKLLSVMYEALENRDKDGGEMLTKLSHYLPQIPKQIASDINEDNFDQIREGRELNNTFSFYENGKVIDIKVDKTLFEAFRALYPGAEETNAFMRGVSKANDIFKTVTVNISPMFFLRNAAQDLQDAGLNTRDYAKFMKNFIPAYSQIATNGEYWRLYKSLGGLFSSFYDFEKGRVIDRKDIKVEDIASALGWPVEMIKKLGDVTGTIGMAVEQAPRLAEFMSVLQTGDRSYDNLMDAMYAAAEVTTNFGKSGSTGRLLNRTFVPFLNPSIQGFVKYITHPTFNSWMRFLSKAIILGVTPRIINELLARLLWDDDDEWKKIRQSEKDRFFLIKTKKGTWIKIPYGRMVSVMNILAGRVINYIDGTENEEGILASVMNQIGPMNPLEDNLISPLAGAALFDKDNPGLTWFGGDIESKAMQSLWPKYRYDTDTDKFSRWIAQTRFGELLNLSPVKINYLLDQYTGVIGDFALPALTPAAESNPLVKAFSINTVLNNNLSEMFYTKSNIVTMDKNAGDKASEVTKKWYDRQSDEISKINKLIKDIENSDIKNKEKKAKILVQTAARNGIMENALKDYDLYYQTAEKYYKNFTGKYPADEVDDMAYLYTNKDMFGSEYALQVYDTRVYKRAKELIKSGINYDEFFIAYLATRGIESDKDAYGNTISLSKSKKLKEAIDNALPKLSAKEKVVLYDEFGVSESVYGGSSSGSSLPSGSGGSKSLPSGSGSTSKSLPSGSGSSKALPSGNKK